MVVTTVLVHPIDRARAEEVKLLAGRLHRTLEAGLASLKALAACVENHAEIEKAAMERIDSVFDHNNKNTPLWERIEKVMRNVPV